MTTLLSILLISCGHGLIFVGIAFLTEQLFPTIFGSFYTSVPWLIRLVLFASLISIPANLLIAEGYKLAGATVAGVTYVIAVVLGTLVMSMVFDGLRLSAGTVGGATLMILGALWITLARHS